LLVKGMTGEYGHSSQEGGAPIGVTARLLHTHYLDDHPFAPLPVEFGIEDPLPGSQVQFAARYRQGCLMVQQ